MCIKLNENISNQILVQSLNFLTHVKCMVNSLTYNEKESHCINLSTM